MDSDILENSAIRPIGWDTGNSDNKGLDLVELNGINNSSSAMKDVLCTIITPDYLDHAIALQRSVRRTGANMTFAVLTTETLPMSYGDMRAVSIDRLAKQDHRASQAKERYSASSDVLRWSLKAVFISYLLRKHQGARVVYADSDTCFFSSPAELLGFLDGGTVLLTPHWRQSDPRISSAEFRTNFLDGIFNAGCVCAKFNGLAALDWWAEVCLHGCEQSHHLGLFADQRYLDLLPVYFADTIICRHRGYNLADWNRHLRTPNAAGHRDVPDSWPVSMVHFTANTIRGIETGDDPVLESYLRDYQQLLFDARSTIRKYRRSSARASANSLSNVINLTEQPVVSSIDLEEGCRRKTLTDATPAPGVLATACLYLRRLQSAKIRCIVCDYDGIFGTHRYRSPPTIHLKSVEMLSTLVRQGLILAITSRRGVAMFNLLRSTFPEELHSSIIVECYNGSSILSLDESLNAPAYSPVFDDLQEWLSRIGIASWVDISEKLSRGGQLSLSVADEEKIGRLQASIRTWLDSTKRYGWRTFSGKYSVDVLQSGISVSNVLHYIADRYRINDIEDVLKIGYAGQEDGSDFELLAHGLALSCGTVSLSLDSCWNFAARGADARFAALSWISCLKCTNGYFRFVSNTVQHSVTRRQAMIFATARDMPGHNLPEHLEPRL